MGANSSINWDIGLAAWIIQDGTYPDFEVGQTAEFALEFCVPRGVAARAAGGKVSANNLGHGMYETIAEVIVQTAQITVLDIGVLVYEHTSFLQPPLPQGPRLAVQLSLGVDAFSCFETLNQTGDVLPLVYSWKILSILRQTAPFVEIGEGGRKLQTKDVQRLGYEEILRTDAWNDHGRHADYLLRCGLLPIPLKRTSATVRP